MEITATTPCRVEDELISALYMRNAVIVRWSLDHHNIYLYASQTAGGKRMCN